MIEHIKITAISHDGFEISYITTPIQIETARMDMLHSIYMMLCDSERERVHPTPLKKLPKIDHKLAKQIFEATKMCRSGSKKDKSKKKRNVK